MDDCHNSACGIQPCYGDKRRILPESGYWIRVKIIRAEEFGMIFRRRDDRCRGAYGETKGIWFRCRRRNAMADRYRNRHLRLRLDPLWSRLVLYFLRQSLSQTLGRAIRTRRASLSGVDRSDRMLDCRSGLFFSWA